MSPCALVDYFVLHYLQMFGREHVNEIVGELHQEIMLVCSYFE